ncbi:hypothetical protein BDN70DRAFT_897509 [Pholiota conissans]|uniref:C2H2-type domain-containing protein n=1 Tax=Pholiota conissans TaxID=109636 RepID=A0A9P5YV69_9AGAR|nr:hypothetical protein BDN70DRAFT_897509 [Pholiota conissans]
MPRVPSTSQVKPKRAVKGSGRYECSLGCGKKFSKKGDVRRHLACHDRQTKYRYKCDVHGYLWLGARQKSNVEVHKRNFHGLQSQDLGVAIALTISLPSAEFPFQNDPFSTSGAPTVPNPQSTSYYFNGSVGQVPEYPRTYYAPAPAPTLGWNCYSTQVNVPFNVANSSIQMKPYGDFHQESSQVPQFQIPEVERRFTYQ